MFIKLRFSCVHVREFIRNKQTFISTLADNKLIKTVSRQLYMC
ncbi:hypothetical protein HPTD01_1602 [Halomonas sp. TD01]|nr:hypothetical protein HPTD01_1602 [Halomonas sp. TD01]